MRLRLFKVQSQKSPKWLKTCWLAAKIICAFTINKFAARKSFPIWRVFFYINLVWKFPNVFQHQTDSSFCFNYVSVVFVHNQLRALKRKKATWLDNLLSALLKDSANEILIPFAHIINSSLKLSSVPTKWKNAKITSVFKGGNANDISN